MSATRSSFASNASVAKHNPSRRVTFDDDISEDFGMSVPYYPRYSPPSRRAAAPASLKRSGTSIKTQQVPPQHEQSTAEADARKAAATSLQRIKTAAARADHNSAIVLQTKNALLKLKSQKTRAIGKAAKWEHEKHLASQALELALLSARASAKRRADGCCRPRRVFEYIMARLEDEPLLDVEKAARVVDKAEQEYCSTRAETQAAREAVDKIAREERATVLLLRNVEFAHPRTVKNFHALETAAVKTEDRAVDAATAVGMGRYCKNKVYASGRGEKMDPLPVTAESAAGVGDGFIDDQVAPKAKRFKR